MLHEILVSQVATIHEPISNSQPPPKSSLIRSQSVRGNDDMNHELGLLHGGDNSTDSTKRYLPKGLHRPVQGSLIMPTRPYTDHHHHGMSLASATSGGNVPSDIESPQWGWYINTTPPTPDMYHSRSSLKKKGETTTTVASSYNAPPMPSIPSHTYTDSSSALFSSSSSSSSSSPSNEVTAATLVAAAAAQVLNKDKSSRGPVPKNRVFQDLQDKRKNTGNVGWTTVPL
jgi:hypothetical protein